LNEKHVYPTPKGRIAAAILILYTLCLYFLATGFSDLNLPDSQDPGAAVERVLEHYRYSAWFVTFAVVPFAIIAAWACANSIQTKEWPSLGGYVPVKLTVRPLTSTRLVWLILVVIEAQIIFLVAMAWWDYFEAINFLKAGGALQSG
jgi:hypothetical protein